MTIPMEIKWENHLHMMIDSLRSLAALSSGRMLLLIFASREVFRKPRLFGRSTAARASLVTPGASDRTGSSLPICSYLYTIGIQFQCEDHPTIICKRCNS